MTDDPQKIAHRAADETRRRLAQQMGGRAKPAPTPPVPAVIDDDPDETRRVELLSVLARCAGDTGKASRLLQDRGVGVSKQELAVLRDRHSGTYATLADEVTRAVEEGIAQTYREIVFGAQRLTKGIIDQLNDDMDNGVMPRDLDRTLGAVTKVMQVGTDKLLSITGRPVAGATGGDPLEALKELERLGVARPLERPFDAETTAEEA